MNKTRKPYFIPILGMGFSIWLLATLAFRLAGQFFFITESAVVLTILYLTVIPSLGIISLITFRKFKLSGLENVVGGVLLVLPGMIIDTFVIQFFGEVFPNMPSGRAASFGSWLMWAYSVVLLTSLVISVRPNTSQDR